MKLKSFFITAALAFLPLSAWAAEGDPITLETMLLDVPTAQVLDRYQASFLTRAYEHGSLMETIEFGVFPRVNLGVSFSAHELIGSSSSIKVLSPDFQAKWKIFDGDLYLPAIAIGMGIAATGFIIMAVGSFVSDLPLHQDIVAAGTSPVKVTPLLLMATYLVLTIAELYISPLGISFVSKVAPPKYQGIMQGGWLGATAIGNQLLFIGAVLYESIPIWMTWTVFVVACCISMCTMLFMLKWLERVAK